MCCNWHKTFVEGSQCCRQAEWEGTELTGSVVEMESKVFVMSRMDRNVEICILQVDHDKPISM